MNSFLLHKRTHLFVLIALIGFIHTNSFGADPGKKKLPNIVYILADDMGYGSVQYNNPKSTIPTPSIDRLAREGMNFTDAHSGSAVCTPTRYGLLTGRHSWRTGLKGGVLWAWFPPLIKKERLTVAEMLKEQGYKTAMIGKWHLGIDYLNNNGKTIAEENEFSDHNFVHCSQVTKVRLDVDWTNINFSEGIGGGPLDHGFDYYFGDEIPNMPPYVFFRNRELLGTPSQLKPTEMFGVAGPMVPGWKLENVMTEMTEEAVAYIDQQEDADQPFFLYFSLTSPHTPIAPSAEFLGKSGLNKYADWIMETDWAVGEVLKALDIAGLSDNTLLIFTTDNGTAGGKTLGELKSKGCDLTHQFRGLKRSLYEGGHHVPFVVRWPGITPAQSSCDECICLTDFMATAAALSGYSLPNNAAVDSYNILNLYKGGKRKVIPPVIHHSFDGGFALRDGDWKILFHLDRGGTEFKQELFNLKDDIKETTDLSERYPEIVANMSQQLKEIIENGRSTAGPRQTNYEDPEWVLPY
jgi:arylsulfatase A